MGGLTSVGMSQDTRKDPRAQSVNLVVRYKSATVDEFIENHSHDVSRGGIFVKTNAPQPPGTLLKFEIRIAADKAVIAGVGRVVWKRDAQSGASEERPSGMGIKFIKIDENSRAVIETLIAQKSDAGAQFLSEAVDAGAMGTLSAPKPPMRPEPQSPLTPLGKAPDASDAEGRKRVTFAGRKATMMGMPASTPPPALTPAAGQVRGQNGPANGNDASGVPVTSALDFSDPLAGLKLDSKRPAAVSAVASAATKRAAAAAEAGVGRQTQPMSFDVPSRESDADPRARPEPTMMKQAAELLADALKEAGGSFDEIGHDPIFDQPLVQGGKSIFDEARKIAPAAGVSAAAAAASRPIADPPSSSKAVAAKPIGNEIKASTPSPTPVAVAPQAAVVAVPVKAVEAKTAAPATAKSSKGGILGAFAVVILLAGAILAWHEGVFGGKPVAPQGPTISLDPIATVTAPSASAMVTAAPTTTAATVTMDAGVDATTLGTAPVTTASAAVSVQPTAKPAPTFVGTWPPKPVVTAALVNPDAPAVVKPVPTAVAPVVTAAPPPPKPDEVELK